jgi:oligo-1,6-glucosidase
VNPNHVWLNAAAQTPDPGSIYHYYRRLIALRRAEPVITGGDFSLVDAVPDSVYAFRRRLGARSLSIFANLSSTAVSPTGLAAEPGRIVLGNYSEDVREPGRLAPWEVRAYRA